MTVRRAAFSFRIRMDSLDMRNYFAFQSSALNTETQREYFINPHCFGDDIALWLVSQLRSRGYAANEPPEQEGFGWYLTFQVDGIAHQAVIGYRLGTDINEGDWLCWIERKAGLLRSIIGKRKNVVRAAVEVIHQILASSPKASAVRIGSEDEI
jgi:hypothetical protein